VNQYTIEDKDAINKSEGKVSDGKQQLVNCQDPQALDGTNLLTDKVNNPVKNAGRLDGDQTK
jgi:hypothetical protein